MQKIALVTGASQGIGEAIAKELVNEGFCVLGVARSKDKLVGLAQQLGEGCFIPVVCDVACSEAVEKASKDIQAKGLSPSLFFLNAGIAGGKAVEDPRAFLIEKHRSVFATNYFGVLSWVEAWLPYANKKEEKTFVVTSSINALFAPPCGSAYAASKAAVARAFEALRLTYYDKGAHFLVVYPGPVATEGLKGEQPCTWPAEKMAKYMVRRALKKKAHSEPSLFYAVMCRLFRCLPDKALLKFLQIFGKKEHN